MATPVIEYPRLRGLIYGKYHTPIVLAKIMGVDRQWITMRLSGKVKMRKEDMDRLRKVLKITPNKVDYFFADKEQVEREEQAEIKKWEATHGPLNF